MEYPYVESEQDGHNSGVLDNYWWRSYTISRRNHNWWINTRYWSDVFPSEQEDYS